MAECADCAVGAHVDVRCEQETDGLVGSTTIMYVVPARLRQWTKLPRDLAVNPSQRADATRLGSSA